MLNRQKTGRRCTSVIQMFLCLQGSPYPDNIGLKLPNRLRRRASIISTLVQLLVFVRYTRTRQTVMEKSVSMDIIHVDIILLSQEWIEKHYRISSFLFKVGGSS